MEIKQHIRLVVKYCFIGLAFLLVACGQEFEGEGGTGSSAKVSEAGRNLYSSQCASCHGANGEGGSGGALVACAACGSVDSLVAKIERDMPSASSPMRGSDATTVAEYILAAFNESANGSVQRSLPYVTTLKPSETVYKLAFELAGRLPTDDEIDTFSQSLAGEKSVIYSFMETDYFYERLKDIFNDSLLTDRFRPENEGRTAAVGNLNGLYNDDNDGFKAKINPGASRNGGNLYNVFPDINGWYEPYKLAAEARSGVEAGQSVSRGYLEFFNFEAISRKPLLLVEYIARNNRDFREFVTGKYTVANRFSFEAFTQDKDNPNMKVVDPDQPLGNGALALVNSPTWQQWSSREALEDYLDVVNLYGRANGGNNVSISGIDLSTYILRDFPYDQRDLKAVQLYYNDESGQAKAQGVPHSGVITDEIFLNKYTATETNVHRNRSRMIYWFFAGKDLLAIEGNRDAAVLEFEDFGNNVGVNDPTSTNADCTVCHDIMDPVAKAFEDYDLTGIYDPRNPDGIAAHDGAIGWGLNQAQIATTGTASNNYNNRELQWLGEQIAADPAYARGIAQIVVKGLTGQEILGEPSIDSPADYRLAYEQQTRLIINAASEFAANNYNIKALIYAISKSAYYRAANVDSPSVASDYAKIGSVRYLPPQLLNQKLRALNSGGWGHIFTNRNRNSQDLRDLDARMILGGKDSYEVLRDVDSVGGIIAAALERMAVEEACDIVYNEFRNIDKSERLLFRGVDDSVDLTANTAAGRTSQVKAIRSTIAHLYLAVLHKEVATNSEEVDIAFELFSDVLAAEVNTDCYTGVNETSSANYVRQAWYAVLIHLLSDYRFVYS